MSDSTFSGKFHAYGQMIPKIFKDGSDAEVAQIAKNIDKLGDFVSELRKIHDANFDLIGQGLNPPRSDKVKRMHKLKSNATTAVVETPVENDPLAGEF